MNETHNVSVANLMLDYARLVRFEASFKEFVRDHISSIGTWTLSARLPGSAHFEQVTLESLLKAKGLL